MTDRPYNTPSEPKPQVKAPSRAQREILITLAQYAGAYLWTDATWQECKLFTTGHHSKISYRTFLALQRNNWIVPNSHNTYILSAAGLLKIIPTDLLNGGAK